MRIVLILVALVMVVIVWRAFVFDRKHRGRLRGSADISADAKQNRDQHNRYSDPGPGM
jgi:hypothetical protein